MTRKEWGTLGRGFITPLIILLFLCNIATPYYDVIDSPLWLPHLKYKKVLLAFWHVGYFVLFLIATRKFYKFGAIRPFYCLALFLTIVYTSKAIVVDYPDCCRGFPIGAPRHQHALTLGDYVKDKILFKVYIVHERERMAWYLNDTFELINSYYANNKECKECFETAIHF